MTETHYFQCDLCREKYPTADEALACEAGGLFDRSKERPKGMMFGNHMKGAMYKDITFALAAYSPDPDKTVWRSPHTGQFHCWATRDKEVCGDSLGNETCGCWQHDELGEYDAKLYPSHPTFVRMVEYLWSENISPTVWNGKRAVPLDEWLKTKGLSREDA